MKASVLIANYNGEKYIDECILSLKNQTFKDFEIIFFDDCSTDNSLKIIEKYKDIKIIKNKFHSDIGSYNQINAYMEAFLHSSGEIIFTLDSDDYFYPNKIEKVIKFYESDIKIAFDLPKIIKDNKNRFLSNNSKNFRISYFPFITQQSCLSLKREIFMDLIDKVKIKKFEDVWFDFRIGIYSKYELGKNVIINDYLTCYRKTSINASAKFKYLSKLWWKRRLDYHNYTMFYCEKYNYKYTFNFDLFLTRIMNFFFE